ncbi:MAG: HNH endonuclease [Planctomycetaceae bacterium]
MNTIFRLKPGNSGLSDDEILEDMRRVAKVVGSQRITLYDYRKYGCVTDATLRKRFGTWTTAIGRAGLNSTRNYRIPNDDLFQNLADVWLKLGEQPIYDDMNRSPSRYCASTYANRFGSFRKALDAFVVWANAKSPPPAVAATQPIAARHTRREPTWRQRALVLMRDGNTCRMCGARPEHGARLHVDHVVPWSKGGETVLDNLQVLCAQCNIGKHDVDPSG